MKILSYLFNDIYMAFNINIQPFIYNYIVDKCDIVLSNIINGGSFNITNKPLVQKHMTLGNFRGQTLCKL